LALALPARGPCLDPCERRGWAHCCRSPWPANGPCFLRTSQSKIKVKIKSVSFRPSAEPRHFSLTRQREVTKRKATRLPRRHCCAVSVPCATRHLRAGANSHIHGLEHARLSPEAGCVARRCTRDPARKELHELIESVRAIVH